MDTTKTIKGLLDALAAIDAGVPMRYWRYSAEAIEEAIALLRAQDPVKPLDENYWKHTITGYIIPNLAITAKPGAAGQPCPARSRGGKRRGSDGDAMFGDHKKGCIFNDVVFISTWSKRTLAHKWNRRGCQQMDGDSHGLTASE